MPQSGTWSMPGESNGQPGRGPVWGCGRVFKPTRLSVANSPRLAVHVERLGPAWKTSDKPHRQIG